MIETYTCYHGTNSEAARSILSEHHFRPSESDTEWIGHGIYFFLDDDPDAYKHAFEWAKHIRKYDTPEVLEATISVDNEDVLDLRDPAQRKFIESARMKIFREAQSRAKTKEKEIVFNKQKLDCFAVNYFCENTASPLRVVIADVYINFYKSPSMKYPASQYPNCTILCLRDETLIKTIENVQKR